MKTITYTLSVLTGILLLSGCANYYYEHGNDNFDKFHYVKAIEQYKKSLSRKEIPDARVHLAEAYRLTNKTDLAVKEYELVVSDPECAPIHKFHYGKMLMSNGNYAEAKYWLSKYLESSPNDTLAMSLISSCDAISSFMIDTTLFTLYPQEFQGMRSSFSAVTYRSGIVYAGENNKGARHNPWNGAHYLDLFYTQKDEDGNWISPQVLKGRISGVYHEGPATFNQEQNVVYFTRSNYLKKKKLDKNADNINNLKIFRAELVDSVWTNLEELPFNSDDYSCGHPSLSEDGRSLYFVSDMPGGSGGTDVYVSSLSADGSNWSIPQNLGPVINTSGNEMFPYFHGVDSLYFASESHNTLGGLDVFFSLKTNKGWSKPTNLNYPLNSSKDDFGFFLDSETHKSGYVSSNRAGEDAVYHFNINDPTLMLRGVVTIKGKGTPIKNAKVTLYSQIDTLVIMTDEKGRYSTRLYLNTNYKIAASKENYLTQSVLLSTVGQKVSMEYIRNFELEEIVIQKPILIPNIYYDFDKWAIRPDAAIELDKIVTLLNDNPKIRIEMGSHTDCRGSYKYNDVLSGKRAKSAVEYLVSKGIDASRLEYHGYGERVLVNDCACEPNRVGAGADCTKEQHQENRRTEFKVIEVLK